MSHSGVWGRAVHAAETAKCKDPEAEASWVFEEQQAASGGSGKEVRGLNGL